MSGMIVTRPPITSIGYRLASPLFTARSDHSPSPTVSGYCGVELKMMQRQEVVVPDRDDVDQQHRQQPGHHQRQRDPEEDPRLARAVDPGRVESSRGTEIST